MVAIFFKRVRNLFIKTNSKLCYLFYSTRYNIHLGKHVKFYRTPSIYIAKGGALHISDNVALNSDNYRYHLNMHSRCKLLIDRPGGQITIGENTRIHGSCVHAYESITIGRNCLIAANCQIFDGNGHDLSFDNVSNRIYTVGVSKPVIIEDNVWLGTNVVVLPGVTIGQGSVISANSVVHKDIPQMVIAGGNPIQIIKKMN